MNRQRIASLYIWAVAAVGIFACLATTIVQAPASSQTTSVELVANALILLILTVLSSVSPMTTRIGSVITVGMAPLFGALIVLPPWAVMWVAALGTIDERRPGKRLPWDRFLFNRGMFVLIYGIPALVIQALDGAGDASRVVALVLAVPVIVFLNIGFVSLAFSLLQGTDALTLARRSFSGKWLTFVALPFMGYLISILLAHRGVGDKLEVFLLYVPLLVYRASLQKQNQLDRWLRDSFVMQSRIVDKRDGQTFGHSQRVGELCEAVARLLNLNEEAVNTIRTGGILHDLGKIAIPDGILLKPAKLTPEEYEIIKTHPVEGAHILAEHPEQLGVAEIVMHHHEKWDATGYPDGIGGERIPIGSRIVNACDAFDTMTVARVFRPSVKTPAEAMTELRELSGSWYDPSVVRALEKVVAERFGVKLPPQEASSPEARPSYAGVLARPRFRRLWIGQAVSYFGDMMNTTGLAIMLYLVTGSPAMVALGLIVKAAPTILFGLMAGPFVDRFDRRRLMIFSDLSRALLTVTIPFFALNWLPGVFIAVFMVATASAFFNPAKQALVPNLVPSTLLVRANSLISSSEKTMELLGYSLAGVIAAVIGWLPLFLIDAATYLFSAVSLLGIPDEKRTSRTSEYSLLGDIRQGMSFILRNAALRSTMALTFFAASFGGLTFPTLVILSYQALHAGAAGYGLLEAVIGAGSIVGALVVAEVTGRYRAGNLILVGVGGLGLMYALAGLASTLWFAVIFLFLAGLINMIYYVPLISFTQAEAADNVRGRVMSSRFLLVQLGLLVGMATAGPLTERVGAQVVFVSSGVLLISAALLGVAFASIRDASLRDDKVRSSLKAPAT